MSERDEFLVIVDVLGGIDDIEVDLCQNLKNCSKSLTSTLRGGLWDRCSLNYFS